MTGAVTGGAEARLRHACTEMEALLWSYALRQTHQDGLFAQSPAMGSFQDMLDTERARAMAQQGGLGLGAMLYHELAPKAGPRPPP